ncbi:MAG: MraY family glycosyltransferase [Bacteroidota bacterium]
MSLIEEYLIVFFLTLFAGVYLNYILLQKSKKYSLKKANTKGIRWGSQTKPISGGITFFIISTLTVIVYIFIYGKEILSDFSLIGIIFAASMAFFMGLADDILNTSPLFKFFVQVLCAIILIYFEIYIKISHYNIINYSLTILWVVGLMNSINMLDNMDGVTGTVSLVIFSGLTVIAYYLMDQNIVYLYLLISIVASIISFLIFNWPPSKMYMGDNGSQFLGIYMAAFSIQYIWNLNGNNSLFDKEISFIAIILIFIIPLTDTITVSVNRILNRKSPFVGGKDHTTHYLLYRGLSEKSVVVIYLIISLVSFCIACGLILFSAQLQLFHFIFVALYLLIIFGALYINTKIIKPD